MSARAEARLKPSGATAKVATHRGKVLIVVNVDWFFWSHRLPIARALRGTGFEVVIAAGSEEDDYAARIEAEGLRFAKLGLRRGSKDPRSEASTLWQLVRLYRQERPDVVHHVTIKPVLYGSIAARLVGVPHVVNAVSGLDSMSMGESLAARARRGLVLAAYRTALASRRIWTIFQNSEDLDLFVSSGIVARDRARLIRGSGVDPRCFVPTPEPRGLPVVLFASRLLWDKGVGELIEASRRLREAGRKLRVVLAGRVDRENPSGIPESTLVRSHEAKLCEWRGFVEDMRGLLREASIVVLLSYREGVPKIPLEAAASGRALVATDVPGCREIALDGVNAVLVPPRDAAALTAAISQLLDDPAPRTRLGRNGREIAVREFAESVVVDATLNLYRCALEETVAP